MTGVGLKRWSCANRDGKAKKGILDTTITTGNASRRRKIDDTALLVTATCIVF
jgi:hypothetical protein